MWSKFYTADLLLFLNQHQNGGIPLLVDTLIMTKSQTFSGNLLL